MSLDPKEDPVPQPPSGVGIGFIGAGSFAQKYLIPLVGKGGDLLSVVTTRGVTAKNAGEKFRFRSYSTEPCDVLTNPSINTVFIATRHDTHVKFAIAALEEGKNVFVEKPLAIDEESLAEVLEVARRRSDCRLMVGYNRRFSPLARFAKDIFQRIAPPFLINYRVNAGFAPKDHWTQTEEGGGRIIGEVCHFVDLLQFIIGSEPVSVFSLSVSTENDKLRDQDNVAISLRFQNGSVAEITYSACGDKMLSKERIEIFGGGQSFIIDDFRLGQHYTGGRCRTLKNPGKGHPEEVKSFVDSIRDGQPSPISLRSLALTSAATFAILDSLRTGLPQSVSV